MTAQALLGRYGTYLTKGPSPSPAVEVIFTRYLVEEYRYATRHTTLTSFRVHMRARVSVLLHTHKLFCL